MFASLCYFVFSPCKVSYALFCTFSVHLITMFRGRFLSQFFIFHSFTLTGLSIFRLWLFSSLNFSEPYLGIFSFLHSYYLQIWSFYSVPHFLDVMCLDFCRFNIFFAWGTNFLLLPFSSYGFVPCLVFYWWTLPLRFLFEFLNFNFQFFSNIRFCLVILFIC